MNNDVSSLLRDLEDQKAIMIAVATGGPKIQEKNPEFMDRRRRIRQELQTLGLQDPNPFVDLWGWYGKWSAGELTTYASRRTFVANMYSEVLDQVSTTKPETKKEPVTHPAGETPRVFFSYSHDSPQHKAWVRDLATRLRANGVDVILDQWELKLGSDLPSFMEASLTASNRVIAVCTETYVFKANKEQGGVGYEKMILTAQLMRDISSDRIIPVIRDNAQSVVVPVFLGSRIYLDFRDQTQFEGKYQELLRDIHGAPLLARPPLGRSPFTNPALRPPQPFTPDPEKYASSALSGRVTFDYSNNNGRFTLGVGDLTFETVWSAASDVAAHAYANAPQIRGIAIANGARDFADIQDARVYDYSSRVRTPRVGEIVLWQNYVGYSMATKVVAVQAKTHGSMVDELTVDYAIAPNGAHDFRTSR